MNNGVSLEGIAARVSAVRERIDRACTRARRDPAGVTLIAVSKTWSAAAVAAVHDAGIADYGENRVQEALAKMTELASRVPATATPRWHLIGRLQTNKVRAAAGRFAILHAVDSERLLRSIAAASTAPQRIMIEVNVSGETTKFGVSPAGLPALVRAAREFSSIQLEGLMTVAPLSSDPDASRPYFRELRRIAADHGLQFLSMGMSGDFEAAIEEGATHIRVGRAIFGERA